MNLSSTPLRAGMRRHAACAALCSLPRRVRLLADVPPALAGAGNDPVVATRQRRRNPAERPRDRRGGRRQRTPQQAPPDAKRDYLIAYLADIILVAKAAEKKKIARQTPTSSAGSPSSRNKLLMEHAAAAAGQGRRHRRGDAQGLRRGRQADGAARKRCARATSWSRPRTRPRPMLDRAQEAAPISPSSPRQKSKDPGAAGRRRSRLFHQGADGAGIRRGRVQAGQGPALRSGEDRSSAGTSSRSRTSAAAGRRNSTRSRTRSRPYVVRKAQAELDRQAARRPPRSSASTPASAGRRRRPPARARSKSAPICRRVTYAALPASTLRRARHAHRRHACACGMSPAAPWPPPSRLSRPKHRSRHAGDRRRAARDRAPPASAMPGPHRRAAGAARSRAPTVAGVFTRSKCPSAPVEWCRAKLKARQRARAGGQFRQRQCLHRQDRARGRASSPPSSPPRRPAASRAKCSSPRPA